MRENGTSGSEGGEPGSTGLPYPYHSYHGFSTTPMMTGFQIPAAKRFLLT